ncbi:hypothetical protein C3L33_23498, partial [Rhododendron williamsianum]
MPVICSLCWLLSSLLGFMCPRNVNSVDTKGGDVLMIKARASSAKMKKKVLAAKMRKKLTNKSDVYSFGVVLIELISSLPAVDINRHRDEINLANLAVNRIQNRAIHELIDPSLGFESDPSIERMTLSVAEVAFRCLQLDMDMRPTMKEIMEALMEIEAYKDENAGKIIDDGSALTTRRPPTSPDGEDVVLLKNRVAPVSPASVTNRWVSTSTTSTSSESFHSTFA